MLRRRRTAPQETAFSSCATTPPVNSLILSRLRSSSGDFVLLSRRRKATRAMKLTAIRLSTTGYSALPYAANVSARRKELIDAVNVANPSQSIGAPLSRVAISLSLL